MPDRLVVDLSGDGQVAVSASPDGGFAEEVSRVPLAWPLDADALEDLRWYLEDYLLAPYGVWEERGPDVQEKLAGWGRQVFGSVFGDGPARFAYERARDRGLELVFRSDDPALLGLPWELMRDGSGPVALGAGGISRTLKVWDAAGTLEVPGGKLRVLVVISRPGGEADVGYQMVARPLLERLDAVRGEVSLTVLRPPTFDALRQAVTEAAGAGEPFHVVHFDGHGAMPGRPVGGWPGSGSPGSAGGAGSRPPMMSGPGEGVLAFERPAGGGVPGGGGGPTGGNGGRGGDPTRGGDLIKASQVAQVLAEGRVPVVVLNACQSGAVGKELEASVATALLKAGCAAVVAMAYSVYAVAAAEFMAAFYESLFAGDSVGQAVTVGRKRLFEQDRRPSLKGDLPLADWLVPVHYLRREVRFPDARTVRPTAAPSLDEALDQIRAAPAEAQAEVSTAQNPLAAVDGVFVGRDDLFYQLETAARLQRAVVLTGPGGTGKTELAKGFARWWRDTGGVDDPRLVLWHSFEPGIATFGLDGVITTFGLQMFGTDFARLDPDQRLEAVKQVLAQYRALLVWDNFESVREMPDPAGATPSLDEAGCAALKGFLDWVRDHSSSAVLVTSRAREDWLGEVRRIGVGGLNLTEAAQYADYLLAPYPAARRRRDHRSFVELLDWLDGHPLAMRLTLPRLDTTDPAVLLADLRGTIPLPAADTPDAGRTTSLAATITYSYAHLGEQTRQLLPAVSLFHGIADVDVLMLFSAEETVPRRFAGISRDEWSAVLDDAARVGLLTGLGGGMYQIHPALPGYLAASWHTEDPDRYDQERQASDQVLCAACAAFARWLTGQIETGDAALAYALLGQQQRTLGTMLSHALDRNAWADAEGMIRALNAYWDTRGLGAEADAWTDRILAATVGPGQQPSEFAESLWLYITINEANRRYIAGRPEHAAQAYRRALIYLQGQSATDWTHGNISVLYHQLGMTAQDRGRLDEADDWYRKAILIREELRLRALLATDYHQLGMTAQLRGRLDEAQEWYRRSLAISETLGDHPRMARTYSQLGRLAEARAQASLALTWNIRCVTLFDEFPSPLTGTGPSALARLARELGMPALEEAWRQVAGQPLPQQVRDYVTSQPDEDAEADT